MDQQQQQKTTMNKDAQQKARPTDIIIQWPAPVRESHNEHYDPTNQAQGPTSTTISSPPLVVAQYVDQQSILPVAQLQQMSPHRMSSYSPSAVRQDGGSGATSSESPQFFQTTEHSVISEDLLEETVKDSLVIISIDDSMPKINLLGLAPIQQQQQQDAANEEASFDIEETENNNDSPSSILFKYMLSKTNQADQNISRPFKQDSALTKNGEKECSNTPYFKNYKFKTEVIMHQGPSSPNNQNYLINEQNKTYEGTKLQYSSNFTQLATQQDQEDRQSNFSLDNVKLKSELLRADHTQILDSLSQENIQLGQRSQRKNQRFNDTGLQFQAQQQRKQSGEKFQKLLQFQHQEGVKQQPSSALLKQSVTQFGPAISCQSIINSQNVEQQSQSQAPSSSVIESSNIAQSYGVAAKDMFDQKHAMTFRSHEKPRREPQIDVLTPVGETVELFRGFATSELKRVEQASADGLARKRQNNKQNCMDLLNLEVCSHPSKSLSASLGTVSLNEEGKDHMEDFTNEPLSRNKDMTRLKFKKSAVRSSQSLYNANDVPWVSLRTETLGRGRNKHGSSSNCDWSLQLDAPPIHRSISVEKRMIVDLGRSPQNPFVQNLRSCFKRNSSQRLVQRRNLSPPDQLTNNDIGNSDKQSRRRASFGKSESKRTRRPGLISSQGSVKKGSHSQKSQNDKTPLLPENVLKKYEDFPDKSLKVSVYKQIVMQIMQAINVIQQIKEFPPVKQEEKIQFKFKKANFNKLLIFDLDETLIHSIRDQDEAEFDVLAENYEDREPDLWVEMESPSSEYGPFQQGVFLRPYLHECLRAANMDYEVAIFTAGYDWYANPIIDKIDPSGTLIQHRFFRQDTQNITFKGQESLYKDLSVLEGIDLNRTLIVDNQVFSFATHLSNGIPITDFYGDKKDCELIKFMKYIHQLASEDNLLVANESQFGLSAMLKVPIESFVEYYEINECSEDDDNDFEEDGCTLQSSPRAAMGNIFRRGQNEESLEIADDQSDEEVLQLNSSFKQDGNSRGRSPTLMESPIGESSEQRASRSTMRNAQLVRLNGVSGTMPLHNFMRLHSVQSEDINNRLGEGLIAMNNQYTRISKHNEGNIGGTLSNVVANDSEHQEQTDTLDNQNEQANQQTNEDQPIIQFTDVLRQDLDNENQTNLRMAATELQPNDLFFGDVAPLVTEDADELRRLASPQQPASKNWLAKNNNHSSPAISSYHKVSLTSEKARQRQDSLGQRTIEQESNVATSLFMKKDAKSINGPSELAFSYHSRLRNGYADNSNNNYLPASIKAQPQMVRGKYSEDNRKGSESFRGMVNVSKLRDCSEGKDVVTFADIVEMEQKTLTTAKKCQISKRSSVKMAPKSVVSKGTTSNLRRSIKPQPSNSFLQKVSMNVNNTLKPPNWTVRKQSLIKRYNTSTTQKCASNIDFHLDQLAEVYRESGKKAREGAEPSLMDQLIEANPENVSFLTPGSSSQISRSLLSEPQLRMTLGSCNSVDKYQQLKRSVNKMNQMSPNRKFLGWQQSAKLATFENPINSQVVTMGSDWNSSDNHVSPKGLGRQPPKVKETPNFNVMGSGMLPPRPASRSKLTQKPEQAPTVHVPKMVHQHSSPEKTLKLALLVEAVTFGDNVMDEEQNLKYQEQTSNKDNAATNPVQSSQKDF